MTRKPLFQHLYFQVLAAIILGACLGYFYPSPPDLWLKRDGTVIEGAVGATPATAKPATLPTNLVASVQTARPNLLIQQVTATEETNPTYRVTFQKRIG